MYRYELCLYDLKKLAKRVIDVSMQARITDFKTLSKQELEQKYLQIFGYPAPCGYTKLFLIKELVWQEKYNKLPSELQYRINKLVKEYEKTKTMNITKVKKFGITVGTKFIREYKGEKYEVIAIENGFKYKGKTYKTLSAVANIITGTHWNGKKFFGVANG